jgi:hypothetical protein
VEGSPTDLQLVGLSPETVFELLWADEPLEGLDGWNRVVAASAPTGAARFTLAPRDGGYWLLWMTDLPEQSDGTYFVELSEVRFFP